MMQRKSIKSWQRTKRLPEIGYPWGSQGFIPPNRLRGSLLCEPRNIAVAKGGIPVKSLSSGTQLNRATHFFGSRLGLRVRISAHSKMYGCKHIRKKRYLRAQKY